MKILHLSFHIGCIRHIRALMRDLGHEIDDLYCRQEPEIPYKITEQVADSIWQQYGEKWNTYDLIFTSDTVALSYIFLRKLDILKPKLFVWICNRYDYAMGDNDDFQSLLRKVTTGNEYLEKVRIIASTEYERIWCGKHNIWIRDPVLNPYGVVSGIKRFNGQVDKKENLKLDTSGMTAPKSETVFISFYHNDNGFFPLREYLKSCNISVVSGEFESVEDLKEYKCIVTLPDAFCKWFAFELLSIGLPVFIPTEEFFQHLNKCVRFDESGKPNQFNFSINNNIVPPDFIDMCEWYKYPEAKNFFSSFEELVDKLKLFTSDKQQVNRRKIAHAAEFHRMNVLNIARKLLEDFNL